MSIFTGKYFSLNPYIKSVHSMWINVHFRLNSHLDAHSPPSWLPINDINEACPCHKDTLLRQQINQWCHFRKKTGACNHFLIMYTCLNDCLFLATAVWFVYCNTICDAKCCARPSPIDFFSPGLTSCKPSNTFLFPSKVYASVFGTLFEISSSLCTLRI